MQTLRVTHKPYSILEIYLVQIYKFCSILYLATFAVHCAVKSHVTMFSTQISYKYIFMHNVDFKSNL